jgi:hypothetical protein
LRGPGILLKESICSRSICREYCETGGYCQGCETSEETPGCCDATKTRWTAPFLGLMLAGHPASYAFSTACRVDLPKVEMADPATSVREHPLHNASGLETVVCWILLWLTIRMFPRRIDPNQLRGVRASHRRRTLTTTLGHRCGPLLFSLDFGGMGNSTSLPT